MLRGRLDRPRPASLDPVDGAPWPAGRTARRGRAPGPDTAVGAQLRDASRAGLSDRLRARPRRTPWPVGPDTAARAEKGGRPALRRIASSASRTPAGSPRTAAWSTGWSGTRVCTRSGPMPGPLARADQSGGPDQQGQRLVGRAEAAAPTSGGRCRGRPRRRPGGPGARRPRCRSDRRGRAHRCAVDRARSPRRPPPRAGRRPPRAAGSRRPAASSCACGHSGADQRAFLTAAGAAEARLGLGDGGATRRALRQLRRSGRRPASGPARSGCKRRPTVPVRRSPRVVEHRAGQAHEFLGEHAAAWVGAPAVDALDSGPARTPRSAGQRPDAHDPPWRPRGGQGDVSRHGHPARRARSVTTSTAL